MRPQSKNRNRSDGGEKKARSNKDVRFYAVAKSYAGYVATCIKHLVYTGRLDG